MSVPAKVLYFQTHEGEYTDLCKPITSYHVNVFPTNITAEEWTQCTFILISITEREIGKSRRLIDISVTLASVV